MLSKNSKQSFQTVTLIPNSNEKDRQNDTQVTKYLSLRHLYHFDQEKMTVKVKRYLF